MAIFGSIVQTPVLSVFYGFVHFLFGCPVAGQFVCDDHSRHVAQVLNYETVRAWHRKFAQTYANQIRRKRPRPGDKWHPDEIALKINGRICCLWRALAQDGTVLDILVQNRRSKAAAKKFFRKLLKGLHYVPRVLIIDKLPSHSSDNLDSGQYRIKAS